MGVSLQFTAAPAIVAQSLSEHWLRSCSDELLNRIWYAGAYTVELNLIDPSQGRVWPPPQLRLEQRRDHRNREHHPG